MKRRRWRRNWPKACRPGARPIQDADDDPKRLEAFDRSLAAIANRADANFNRNGLAELVEAGEKKYRMPVGSEWYGYVGNAMDTPVSDGERVYVLCGLGRVAAYDLDGRLRWPKRFAENWHKAQTCNLSPRLCDNGPIFKFPDDRTRRVLDARTGALLWERKDTPRLQFPHSF